MVGQCVRDLRNVSICINHLECNYYFYTRNTCIAETREARGVGKAHKTSGMEGGERIGVNCVAWEGGFQYWP